MSAVERLTFDPAAMRSAARTINRVRVQVEADAMLTVNRPLPRMPPNVNAVVCTGFAELRQTARAASHEFVSVSVELDLRAFLAELADADCGPWDWLFDDFFLLDTIAPWGDMVCGDVPWADISWDDIPWGYVLTGLAKVVKQFPGLPLGGLISKASYYQSYIDIYDAFHAPGDERIEAIFRAVGALVGAVALSALAAAALGALFPLGAPILLVVGVTILANWAGSKIGGWAGGELGKLVNWGIENADEIGEGIVDAVTAVGGAIVDGAEAVGGAIVDGAEAVGGAIVDGAEAVGGAVVDGAEAVGGAIVDGAEAVGGAVVDGAEAVGGAVVDGLEEIGDIFGGSDVLGVVAVGLGDFNP